MGVLGWGGWRVPLEEAGFETEKWWTCGCVISLGPFQYDSACDVVDHLEKIHGRDDSCCEGSLTSEYGLPNFEHGEVLET